MKKKTSCFKIKKNEHLYKHPNYEHMIFEEEEQENLYEHQEFNKMTCEEQDNFILNRDYKSKLKYI